MSDKESDGAVAFQAKPYGLNGAGAAVPIIPTATNDGIIENKKKDARAEKRGRRPKDDIYHNA